MKRIFMIIASFAMAVALGACGNGQADPSPTASGVGIMPSDSPITSASQPAEDEGVISAESKPDDHGSSAKLGIGFDGDKISTVVWQEYSNGELKDENYGKDMGDEQYKNAQNALKGSKTYPEQLLEKQDIEKVEAVSGATASYESFVELYKEVIKKR